MKTQCKHTECIRQPILPLWFTESCCSILTKNPTTHNYGFCVAMLSMVDHHPNNFFCQYRMTVVFGSNRLIVFTEWFLLRTLCAWKKNNENAKSVSGSKREKIWFSKEGSSLHLNHGALYKECIVVYVYIYSVHNSTYKQN